MEENSWNILKKFKISSGQAGLNKFSVLRISVALGAFFLLFLWYFMHLDLWEFFVLAARFYEFDKNLWWTFLGAQRDFLCWWLEMMMRKLSDFVCNFIQFWAMKVGQSCAFHDWMTLINLIHIQSHFICTLTIYLNKPNKQEFSPTVIKIIWISGIWEDFGKSSKVPNVNKLTCESGIIRNRDKIKLKSLTHGEFASFWAQVHHWRPRESLRGGKCVL